LVGVTVLIYASASVATPLTFDDNGFVHGSVVNSQINGVTISANNVGGGPNLAVAFDSTETGTRDSDLEDAWSGGNIDSNEVLGMLLIIQENSVDNNGDGIMDNPDDEGSRPAGSLIFDFDMSILEIGFDLVDIEDVDNEPGKVVTVRTADNQIGELTFEDLAMMDSTIQFGDNSANRISLLSAVDFGLAEDSVFNSVEFELGGSGALDNIVYTAVPEPSVLALFGMGLAAVGLARRRQRKAL
ncbi:MAG: PEP-CTERM sorting domain-containing protein, partial [Pseudomonadota bacterium]